LKVFEKRSSSKGTVDQRIGVLPEDPKQIAPNIASIPPPTVKSLVEEHKGCKTHVITLCLYPEMKSINSQAKHMENKYFYKFMSEEALQQKYIYIYIYIMHLSMLGPA
jgi:hypothetical protein